MSDKKENMEKNDLEKIKTYLRRCIPELDFNIVAYDPKLPIFQQRNNMSENHIQIQFRKNSNEPWTYWNRQNSKLAWLLMELTPALAGSRSVGIILKNVLLDRYKALTSERPQEKFRELDRIENFKSNVSQVVEIEQYLKDSEPALWDYVGYSDSLFGPREQIKLIFYPKVESEQDFSLKKDVLKKTLIERLGCKESDLEWNYEKGEVSINLTKVIASAPPPPKDDPFGEELRKITAGGNSSNAGNSISNAGGSTLDAGDSKASADNMDSRNVDSKNMDRKNVDSKKDAQKPKPKGS